MNGEWIFKNKQVNEYMDWQFSEKEWYSYRVGLIFKMKWKLLSEASFKS